MGLSEQIMELQDLLRSGGISQEEFEAAKHRLLGIPAAVPAPRPAPPAMTSPPAAPMAGVTRGPAIGAASSTGRADPRGGFLLIGAMVSWLAWLLFADLLLDLPGLLPDVFLFAGQVLYFCWPLIAMGAGSVLFFISTDRAEVRGLAFGVGASNLALSISWLSWHGTTLPVALLGVLSAGLAVGSAFFWRKR